MSLKPNRNVQHIVLFSGGLASFEVARRVISKFGRKNVRLWFFDTRVEDEDLYRFLKDAENLFSIKIERFEDGRNPWQVFKDERFIGNSRVDICSKILKRNLLEKLLHQHFPNKKQVTLYFGLEWTETHRMEVLKPRWSEKGYRVEFPLTWKPLLEPNELAQVPQSLGITIPRLYTLGFSHNNCGGACIKAGIKQWSLLWYTFPERYRWHERNENALREYLRKDVSILRDRKNGSTKPLTLTELRERLQALEFDGVHLPREIESLETDSPCSCFVNLIEVNPK